LQGAQVHRQLCIVQNISKFNPPSFSTYQHRCAILLPVCTHIYISCLIEYVD